MELDTKNLKLLQDLEALNGLPLEKAGVKIKESLNISGKLLKDVKKISNPYILIVGDINKAMQLAVYIYLTKSTVYCSAYLREGYIEAVRFKQYFEDHKDKYKQKYGTVVPNKNKPYVWLFYVKDNQGDFKNITYCFYIDKKGFISTKSRIDLEDYCDYVTFADHYRTPICKPLEVTGVPIKEMIYVNKFIYKEELDFVKNPDVLMSLEVSDKECPSLKETMFVQIKGKSTVFLSNFMYTETVRNKYKNEINEFTIDICKLKKTKPGFLIIHVNKIEGLTGEFLEQFNVINIDSSPQVKEAQSEKKIPIDVGESSESGMTFTDESSTVKINGTELDLTNKDREYKFLKLLYDDKGTFVEDNQIADHIEIDIDAEADQIIKTTKMNLTKLLKEHNWKICRKDANQKKGIPGAYKLVYHE